VQNPVDFAVADTDPSLGNPDAPVTIIEFGDFECPFCKKFSLETKPQLEKNEINEGKVRLIWKDFPLSIHSRAEAAHEAARCAQDQGKFWEYHDLLYANQQQLGKNDLKKYATELRLDTKEFNECVDSRRFSNLVAEGLAEGTAAGVRGTPSFLINGRLVVGALPYATFSQAIEDAFKR
jgi:protein-disulfide isomerase